MKDLTNLMMKITMMIQKNDLETKVESKKFTIDDWYELAKKDYHGKVPDKRWKFSQEENKYVMVEDYNRP